MTFLSHNAKILKETWGTNTLIPLYDNEDSVCGIIYNNKSYYFLKNLQGDIIEILDGDTGNTVTRYRYNAWGVCKSVQDYSGCNIATINPFRYRGYYYDNEIQMYYLQSRYYDPNTGRFINGDEASILKFLTGNSESNNLYTYCFNNPIKDTDESGTLAVRVIISAIVGGVTAAVLEIILQLIQGIKLKTLKWSSIAIEFLNGALTGALIGLNIKPSYSKFGKALINMVTSIAHGIRNKSTLWAIIGSALLSGLGTYIWNSRKFKKGKSKFNNETLDSVLTTLKNRFSRFSIRLLWWTYTIKF